MGGSASCGLRMRPVTGPCQQSPAVARRTLFSSAGRLERPDPIRLFSVQEAVPMRTVFI